MDWQELRKEAYNLSVSDRLALVEAIVRSVHEEIRPRPPVPPGVVNRLRGILKTDGPPPTDEEIEAIKEERLNGEILKMRVLLDTNIILDYFLERKPLHE